MALEIVRAEGCTLWDASGKSYTDLIGGISVANTGHRHPAVLAAIQKQLDAYLHVMVYGEFIQAPQVQYARLLTRYLPPALDTVYFTASGAEAVEGAMKLAKRLTGRTQIIAFDQAYHGSTQGALSIMGSEYWRNAFRPLLPGIRHLRFNDHDHLRHIDASVACVVVETVQGEAGLRPPDREYMSALRKRCSESGTLMVLDEIQAGFGRTGKLWGFEHFGIVPDILLLGKALGGGMPLGAFIASHNVMQALTENPVLGHITTFGGHPVCCAAGMAALKVVLDEQLADTVSEKEQLFRSLLVHRNIRELRSFGLWMALALESAGQCKKVIDGCIREGVVTDWFLFAPHCLRIAPPLTIKEPEIRHAAAVILRQLDLC